MIKFGQQRYQYEMQINRKQNNKRQSSLEPARPENKTSKLERQNSLKIRQRINSFQSTYDRKLNYNFTVAVRVKPQLGKMQGQRQSLCLSYQSTDSQTLILQYPDGYTPPYSVSRNKKFNFDNIIIDKTNRQIYHTIIRPKIPILKQNINLTLLTYGITGSGKTHTIFGNKEIGEQGIAMLCFEDVIRQQIIDGETIFALSFMQIYNEQVHDLLQQQISNFDSDQQIGGLIKLKSLNVMEDSKGKVNIPELTKVEIHSINDLKNLIEKGNNIRACSSNMINKLSSRSHALLQLFCYNKQTKIQNIVTIIDLAGSERNNSSYSSVRDRSKDKQNLNLQKQGSNINRSLLALGSCIKGLESGQSHIPYRDSKLTRILKDDLSGKAHNIMIACVGRNFSQSEETVNTLQYASRAAKIKVEKMKNTPKNDGFECSYCFKLTSWKDIMDKIPENIIQSHPKFKSQINNHASEDNQFISKLFSAENQKKRQVKNKQSTKEMQNELSGLMSKFKQQIIQFFNLNESEQNICSTSGCLFPKNSARAEKSTARQIMSSGVQDIFNFYQEKLGEFMEKGTKQGQVSNIPNGQLNLWQHQNRLSNTLQLNLKQWKHHGTALVQKKGKEQLQDNGISQFSKTLGCLNVTNNCSLESYRDQVLSEQSLIGSNLRKKLSIKNKNYLNSINSTNTTLTDISKMDSNNEKQLKYKSKTQRMNPDIEQQQETDIQNQTKNEKHAIIRKIEEAKKKYILELQYTHQNCSRFSYEDEQNDCYDNEKVTKVKLKDGRANTFINIRDEDNKNQIYVSSFMEDSNQFL